jgi:hypothetical protein
MLTGVGNGAFIDQRDIAAGTQPIALAAGRLDQDPWTDVVVANIGSDDVSVLLGDGKGGVLLQRRFVVGGRPAAVGLGDFNRDGHEDIVTSNVGSGTVSLLLGVGDGTFQPQRPLAVGQSPIALLVLDADGDGTKDVVTASALEKTLSILLGNGDETFRPARQIALLESPIALTATHLSIDGRPDLVALTGDGMGVVLINSGDGAFAISQRFPVGPGQSAVVADDFNQDGAEDLAVLFQNTELEFYGSFSILLGRGDGSVETRQQLPDEGYPLAVAVADMDKDGVAEIITANRDAEEVVILFRKGLEEQLRYKMDMSPTSLALGDLNRDANVDIAVGGELNGRSDSGLVLFLGDGDGFVKRLQLLQTMSSVEAVAVADVNGDDSSDILSGYDLDRGAAVWLGNGDGTFQTRKPIIANNSAKDIGVGDLDSNGTLDLVISQKPLWEITVMIGNGDGTFQSKVVLNPGNRPEALALGDVDDDGHLDLVTANSFFGFAEGNGAIYYGKGDGAFLTEQVLSTGLLPTDIVLADVSGDKLLDIVTANRNSNDISVIKNQGNRTFQRDQRIGAWPAPRALVVYDLNGDEKPDLIVANSESDDLSILLHR